MKELTKKRAGTLVTTVLATDGLAHLYWASGNTWPAPDSTSLSLAVLNAEVPFTPPVVLPLAGLLFLGSATALARVDRLGGIGRFVPHSLLQFGTAAIASGLLLRGSAGVVWALGIGADTNTPFYWLNLTAYTPACLVLFAAAVAAARSERP